MTSPWRHRQPTGRCAINPTKRVALQPHHSNHRAGTIKAKGLRARVALGGKNGGEKSCIQAHDLGQAQGGRTVGCTGDKPEVPPGGPPIEPHHPFRQMHSIGTYLTGQFHIAGDHKERSFALCSGSQPLGQRVAIFNIIAPQQQSYIGR